MSESIIKKTKIDVLEPYTPKPINLSTGKARTKFIKRVESIVRRSMEYKDYIAFLKEHVNMDHCSFFENISSRLDKKAKIEIHHEPLTLYDIVNIVLTKYESEGLPYNDLYIADEVLELHYKNMVGLIPLSITLHKMVHNSDKLPIPLSFCYGEYNKLIEDYSKYDIPEEIYDKLERKINISKNITPDTYKSILKEYEYLDVSGVSPVEKMEEVNKNEKILIA